jgi:hypothetical protein
MPNDWKRYTKEEWQETILDYYLLEFGAGPELNIEFYVDW